MCPVSRRSFLQSGLVAATITALPSLARAADPSATIAEWIELGPFRVLPILDSTMSLTAGDLIGDIRSNVAANALRMEVHAHVVRFRGRNVLVGTGAGSLIGGASAKLGLLRGLAAADLSVADIDLILLTHLHPEHVGGLTDANGEAVFPRAQAVMCRTEWGWWNENDLPPGLPGRYRPHIAMVRAATRPYQSRTQFVSGTVEVAPGITGMPALGHTAGHTIFRFDDGAHSLLTLGDMVLLPALQLADPKIRLTLDMDPDLASSTRHHFLEMARRDRLLAMGSHLSMPGVGRFATTR